MIVTDKTKVKIHVVEMLAAFSVLMGVVIEIALKPDALTPLEFYLMLPAIFFAIFCMGSSTGPRT
jgi:hypothetical protein